MKAMTLLAALTAFSLLSGGCVTGSRYDYVAQKDSACVEGPLAPMQRIADYGSCSVILTKVDGLVANFEASRPGANWAFTVSKYPLYLAPGEHAITLEIEQIDQVRSGSSDAYVASSQRTLTAEFMANHSYRFTADLSTDKRAINIGLWDETGGDSARLPVAKWTVDSNRSYSEDIPPVHKR